MGTLRQRATSLSPIYFKTKEKGWERCSIRVMEAGSQLLYIQARALQLALNLYRDHCNERKNMALGYKKPRLVLSFLVNKL